MTKRVLLIELLSDEEIDLDAVVNDIDNAISNGDDTGVEEWTIMVEVEEDERFEVYKE